MGITNPSIAPQRFLHSGAFAYDSVFSDHFQIQRIVGHQGVEVGDDIDQIGRQRTVRMLLGGERINEHIV